MSVIDLVPLAEASGTSWTRPLAALSNFSLFRGAALILVVHAMLIWSRTINVRLEHVRAMVTA
jgi:hypothetical protein